MNLLKVINDLEVTKLELLKLNEEIKHFNFDTQKQNNNVVGTFSFNNPIAYNGLEFYMFYFEDVIPSYKGQQKDKEYGKSVSRYYNLSIARQTSNLNKKIIASKFLIVIDQKFKGKYKRDLDNRNRKLVIDAIKHNHLINDDTAADITILENGNLNEDYNETIVYVVPYNNTLAFLEAFQKGKFNSEIKKRREILMEFTMNL